MEEKDTNPVQTAPVQAEPVQTVPVQETATAEPPRSKEPRQGGGLLVFLTVLLILVGIIDVILWGVAGYYLLRSHQSGGGGEPAQIVSTGETPSGGGEAGGF